MTAPDKGRELLARLMKLKNLPIVPDPTPGYRPEDAQQQHDAQWDDIEAEHQYLLTADIEVWHAMQAALLKAKAQPG